MSFLRTYFIVKHSNINILNLRVAVPGEVQWVCLDSNFSRAQTSARVCQKIEQSNFISIKIRQVSVRALIDTGAYHSCVLVFHCLYLNV